jgi:hypothetical protein
MFSLLPPRLDDVIYAWICKSGVIQFIVAPLSVTVEVNKHIFAEFSLVFASYASCFHHHLKSTFLYVRQFKVYSVSQTKLF